MYDHIIHDICFDKFGIRFPQRRLNETLKQGGNTTQEHTETALELMQGQNLENNFMLTCQGDNVPIENTTLYLLEDNRCGSTRPTDIRITSYLYLYNVVQTWPIPNQSFQPTVHTHKHIRTILV